MQFTYNPQAPKRSANLSENADLLDKAKESGINLSATLELALAAALQEKQRGQWRADNKTVIDAYNDHIEKHGVFSDGLRSF